MQIKLNNNNKILAYAKIGSFEGGIEIEPNILPENFINEFEPEKYLYINGEIIENPDFEPYIPPEEPSVDEKISALEAQNQMLTDCLLEMSEIVYGGDI